MRSLASPVIWVCFSMLIGMMGTALISPLYPVYVQEWGLAASQISLLYVLYMVAALGALLMLGRLSDQLGYRRVLVGAIVLTLIGTLMSLAAQSLLVLVIGRMLVGVASSLATTAGASALRLVLPPERMPRMPLIYTLVLALGFGLGPFMGGVIGQVSARPLVDPYWPTVICGLIAWLGLWAFVPESRPRIGRVTLANVLPAADLAAQGAARGLSGACTGTFLCFMVFGLYATMVPLFIEDMMHLRGPLVSGISIAAIFLISSLTQLVLQKQPLGCVFRGGLVCFALCVVALFINLRLNAPWLFVLGVAVTSIGHGMSLLGSMSMVNAVATADNQAGLTATYMVSGYVGAVASSILMGFAADTYGMIAAVSGFCVVIFVLSLGIAALSWRRG